MGILINWQPRVGNALCSIMLIMLLGCPVSERSPSSSGCPSRCAQEKLTRRCSRKCTGSQHGPFFETFFFLGAVVLLSRRVVMIRECETAAGFKSNLYSLAINLQQ